MALNITRGIPASVTRTARTSPGPAHRSVATATSAAAASTTTSSLRPALARGAYPVGDTCTTTCPHPAHVVSIEPTAPSGGEDAGKQQQAERPGVRGRHGAGGGDEPAVVGAAGGLGRPHRLFKCR